MGVCMPLRFKANSKNDVEFIPHLAYWDLLIIKTASVSTGTVLIATHLIYPDQASLEDILVVTVPLRRLVLSLFSFSFSFFSSR